MTRLLSRLAPFVTVICALCDGATALADAPACTAAAVLLGNADLVGEVAIALGTHGIDAKPHAGCPSVQVQLSREDGYIVVDVSDHAGRMTRRTVAHVEEAVSVIESWARPDINADLLAGFAIEPDAPPTPLDPAPPIESAPAVPLHSSLVASLDGDSHVRRHDPLSVRLDGGVAFDRAGVTWLGTTLAACVPVWRICVGGAGSIRRATTSDTPSERAVLAGVDVPVRLGRFMLLPGFGVGIGQSSSTTGGMQMGNVDDASAPQAWGLRAEVHVSVSYPIARWVHVDATLGAVAAPYANRQQNQDGATAEPDLLVALSVGLRVGAP